jgi:hypothetical protein
VDVSSVFWFQHDAIIIISIDICHQSISSTAATRTTIRIGGPQQAAWLLESYYRIIIIIIIIIVIRHGKKQRYEE